MENMGFTKKDWMLFRNKIAGWQEAYMDKLNKEYIELLSGEGTPSEKFWGLKEKINEDRKKTGVLLEMSRSKLIHNILSLIHEGAIDFNDLEDFSDELKEGVRSIVKIQFSGYKNEIDI